MSSEAPSAWPSPERLRDRVELEAERIARLGAWPAHIDRASLAGRIPGEDAPAPGFDAGIACALGMIPASKQRLAACLHAAYTPEAVEQVIRESRFLDSDSETCWWLAACSVCEEGELSPDDFRRQIEEFGLLVRDPQRRLLAARKELAAMKSRYELRWGVAYSEVDGGMQGAYIDGHRLAVMRGVDDIFFIGTYTESLGLESFEFGPDPERSGPVHGSRQFVKASDEDELERALAAVDPSLKG